MKQYRIRKLQFKKAHNNVRACKHNGTEELHRCRVILILVHEALHFRQEVGAVEIGGIAHLLLQQQTEFLTLRDEQAKQCIFLIHQRPHHLD